jgi:hypothetical protein
MAEVPVCDAMKLTVSGPSVSYMGTTTIPSR